MAREGVRPVGLGFGARASRFGTLAVCVLLFFVALLIYRSNDGFLYTYDSAPTSLFVFNFLEHHTFAFDAFRGGYFYGYGASYIFTEAPNGHLEPIFPIGTALLTAPLYCFDYFRAALGAPFPDITSIAFETARVRYEKDAASLVAAAAAVLFFLCARRLAALPVALLATAAFAFGTNMWVIGSQALWQHGTVNLITLAMTYALMRETRSPRAFPVWLAAAGICAGFLPVVRPTAALFLLAGLAFALWHRRRAAWPFLVGACIGIAPGVAWNALVFHSLVGGYVADTAAFVFTWQQASTAFVGLLVSPSKGLLIYSPFFVLSALGVARAARSAEPEARLLVFLAGACALTVANYAFYQAWIGGSSFGPRFLTDVSAVGALLLTYALPRENVRRLRGPSLALVAFFAVALCYAIGVQIVGANGESKSMWSGVPLDADRHPERVWQRTDTQIERDFLTVYRLWRGNPTFTASYAGGFSGRALDVRRLDGAPGTTMLDVTTGKVADLIATVEDTGTARWYGYDSGIYFGQARVRVRIYATDGREVSESYLYLAGSPKRGERTTAFGTFRAPALPGSYTAVFDVDCFQVAAVSFRKGSPQLRERLIVRNP